MFRKIFFLTLILSLLMASCGTLEISLDVTPASAGNETLTPSTATPEPERVFRLSMDSTSEEITRMMTESATTWKTIWLDGIITDFSPQGDVLQRERHQVWIDQDNLVYRVLWGQQMDSAASYKVGNAMSVLEMDLSAGGMSNLYQASLDASASHFVPPLMQGMAYPNPIGSTIGDRAAGMAFSSDYAQSEGTFVPVGIELIAGRQALTVDWTYIQSQQPSRRLWLDVEKAVILKMQNFEKGGGGPLNSDYEITQVVFDASFNPDLFSLAPATLPNFSDIGGGLEKPVETEAAPQSGPDPLGEVYFFVADRSYPVRQVDLVRLPGSCVAGLSACPSPEKVDTPFDLVFSLSSLVWSPDYSQAAFAYPISADGNTSGLFVFNPADESWTKVAEFPFIDPPYWSPNGKWLAFREQDGTGLGGETIYVVRPDGSLLTDVTDFPNLPAGEAPFVINGWLGENLLLSPSALGKDGEIHRVRVEDGYVEPLFGTFQTKSIYSVSPNGQWMAYLDYDYSSSKQTLKLLKPGGSELRDLAVFPGGSILALTWALDSSRLAFVHLNNDSMTSVVYVVNRDGSGLQQVYAGDALLLNFSPDGQFLLIEGFDGIGQHLIMVDLSTLDFWLVQAPGLQVDTDWMMASWRVRQ